MSPRELFEHLHAAAFNEDVTYAELLHVALAFAVFWYFAFEIGKFVLGKWSYGKPWLKAGTERDFDRNEEQMRSFLGKDKSRDEIVDFMMKNWPAGMVMSVQHFVGGALCTPSLIGYGDPAWASSLACLGILSEMGWEIEDTVETLYKRLRYGKQKVPNASLAVMVVHHGLTSSLGPILILAYRDLRTLHWICFDLQIVGITAVLSEYAKFLDVTKQPDLMKFKVINFIMLVIMGWTRGLHWLYLVVDIYVTWWNDERWTFMVVGAVPVLLFSCLSIFLLVIPAWKRFLKFLHKSAKFETMPKDAPNEDRRKSVVAMNEAAAYLLDVAQDPVDAMSEYLLEALEEKPAKRIERRQTMNPKLSATRKKSYRMMKYMSVPADAKFKDA